MPEIASNDWDTPAKVTRDAAVVEAAWEDESWQEDVWEEDDEQAVGGPALGDGGTRSVVVKRSEASDLVGEDPLERSPRIAQRSDEPFDPFDEPEGEPLAELPNDEEEPLVEDTVSPPVFEETLDQDPLDADSPIEQLQPDRERVPPSELDIELPAPEQPPVTIRPLQQPDDEQLAEELQESQESCEDEIAALEADTIDKVDLSIRLEGTAGYDYPYECQLSVGQYQPRRWQEITYNWKASALCHKPLYFEQVQLERYGHTCRPCVQPIISGAHFFGSIFVLPYKMGIHTPNECIYTLGHYRPGSCAPHMLEAVPFTWRAALFQTGAVTATAFIVP